MCAVLANSSPETDPKGARKLGRASLGVSIAGIVITVIIIAIIVSLRSAADCPYRHYGTCYKYRLYVGYSGYCSGVKSDSYCYYH